MKILVAGGAGFIGCNFIFYTYEKYPGARIVCFDSLTYAANLPALERAVGMPGFKFVKGDVADETAVKELFANDDFDYVVNFAAESHVDRSIENPKIFFATNVLGTQTLMDACRNRGTARFHQVSTDEVYGDLPLSGGAAFTEESPLKPSSPYAASKAAADLLALAYRRTYDFPVTITRCSNNYGPMQYPEKFIPLAISRAARGEKIPVYGNGQNIRDWIAVADHCAAIDLVARKGSGVYNVGGRNEISNLALAKLILKETGRSESLINFVKDRAGHDLRYAVDPSKLESELGWRPATPFAEGIKKTIEWYLDHDISDRS